MTLFKLIAPLLLLAGCGLPSASGSGTAATAPRSATYTSLPQLQSEAQLVVVAKVIDTHSHDFPEGKVTMGDATVERQLQPAPSVPPLSQIRVRWPGWPPAPVANAANLRLGGTYLLYLTKLNLPDGTWTGEYRALGSNAGVFLQTDGGFERQSQQDPQLPEVIPESQLPAG